MATSASAAISREAGRPPVIETVTIEDPRPDEVLVEIRGVGVCHTDMVMRDGLLPVPMPVVLGHEGAGAVLAVGSDIEDLAVGDHVVLSFMSCNHCPSCDDSQPAYCHSWVPLNFFGTRPDGSTALSDDKGQPVHGHIFGQSSFASHALVNRRNVVKVGKDLPIEMLGPLGCGLMTGAGAVLNSCKVRKGSSLAVIGTGAVGLAAIMAGGIAGASTIAAIDINERRIALALEIGATHGFLSDAGSYQEMAAQAGCPAGFDYIIDTTGIMDLVNEAIGALAPRGEIALVGAYPFASRVMADATHVMSAGRVIRGVVEGGADPQTFIPQLLEYHSAGKFPFDRLIGFFDFADIAAAIEAGESGQVIKPVLRFSSLSCQSQS